MLIFQVSRQLYSSII